MVSGGHEVFKRGWNVPSVLGAGHPIGRDLRCLTKLTNNPHFLQRSGAILVLRRLNGRHGNLAGLKFNSAQVTEVAPVPVVAGPKG